MANSDSPNVRAARRAYSRHQQFDLTQLSEKRLSELFAQRHEGFQRWLGRQMEQQAHYFSSSAARDLVEAAFNAPPVRRWYTTRPAFRGELGTGWYAILPNPSQQPKKFYDVPWKKTGFGWCTQHLDRYPLRWPAGTVALAAGELGALMNAEFTKSPMGRTAVIEDGGISVKSRGVLEFQKLSPEEQRELFEEWSVSDSVSLRAFTAAHTTDAALRERLAESATRVIRFAAMTNFEKSLQLPTLPQ